MITPAAPTNLVGALFVGAARYRAVSKKKGGALLQIIFVVVMLSVWQGSAEVESEAKVGSCVKVALSVW